MSIGDLRMQLRLPDPRLTCALHRLAPCSEACRPRPSTARASQNRSTKCEKIHLYINRDGGRASAHSLSLALVAGCRADSATMSRRTIARTLGLCSTSYSRVALGGALQNQIAAFNSTAPSRGASSTASGSSGGVGGPVLREDRADRLASNNACLFSIRSPSGPAATPLTAELRTGSGKGVSQLLRKVGYLSRQDCRPRVSGDIGDRGIQFVLFS